MDGLILPALIALTVGLVVFAIFQATRGAMQSGKRKLQQRLSGEGRPLTQSNSPRLVTLRTEETALPKMLARVSLLEGLRRRLLQAYPDCTLTRFLTIAGSVALTLLLLVGALADSLVMGLIVGCVGGAIPFLLISFKRSKRQRMLAEQLPDALDFLSRVLKAGHSFSTGLQMMGEELPAPLGIEFRRCYDQHSLGQPLEEGLKEMAGRIETTDFAFFVTAVLIQRQTGGDLSEVLSNISKMIRQRFRLQLHVKAKTAEGRFTGYILVAFPAVMFVISYVMNPQYASVLLNTSTGLTLLGIAFGLQMMGLFAIRKITTVRV